MKSTFAMKIRYFLLVTVVASATLVLAQPVRKAEKQMKYYNYSKAISILLKIAEQEKYSSSAIPLLAECYRLQNDPFNTKAWYAKAIKLPDARPEWYLYYAKALMTTGEYKQAREMFLRYAELNPTDASAEKYAAMCDSVMGPWKKLRPQFEIKRVHSINTPYGDFGPAFYNQQLIFSSDRFKPNVEGRKYGWTGRGYLDIYATLPAAPGEFWGEMKTPVLMKGIFNQTFHDGPIVFSKDGKMAFLTRTTRAKDAKIDHITTNLLKIYYTEKQGDKWGKLIPFPLNSNEYSVGHPAISADGKTLYFVSDMPGGQGGTDIWKCERSGNSWGQPQNLGVTINTAGNEMFPFEFDDGTLFFASDGWPGYGGLDIFMAANKNGIFQKPVNLHAPINSSYDDFAIAVAPSSNLSYEWNGFFSSARAGGEGNDDIYAFRKLEATPSDNDANALLVNKTEKCLIQGFVKDRNTLQPIAEATIFVLDSRNGNIKVLKTNPSGQYKMEIEVPSNYIVKAMKPDYISDCLRWQVDKILADNILTAPRDLLLDKLEVNKSFIIENIYYDFDKYNIRKDAEAELDKLVNIMIENPIIVELGSHTDCRGSSRYNEKLSQNRAESAVRYIVSKGINPYRIKAKGYGETQLINRCADGVSCSEQEHQANRRTEFKVTRYVDYRQVSDQFNPDLFGDGEEISAAMLPGGFFFDCIVNKNEQKKPEKKETTAANELATPVSNNAQIPGKNNTTAEKNLTASLEKNKNNSNSMVKEKQAVALPETAVKPETPNYIYTIQFATNHVDPMVLETIPNAKVFKGSDGIKRYYAGSFRSKAEALAKIPFYEGKGFADAWIAPIDQYRPLNQ